MSKMDCKGELLKPAKQLGKASGSKPPPTKRTISDVSPNSSVEEITVLSHQLEGLSEDMKSVRQDQVSMRDDLKLILKKDEMEKFIQTTIAKVIAELNENMEMTISVKVDEKTKEFKQKVNKLETENESLKRELMSIKTQVKKQSVQIEESETRSRRSLAKSNYNEQYSRKNNIKIMDLKEKPNEKEDDLISDVTILLQKQGIALNQSKIMAIHRIPGKPGHTKPVLMKLMNNNEKAKIMTHRSAIKTMGHRLVDDVTRLNAELIRRLSEHKNVDQAWYFNGSVYGRTTNGTRQKFDLFDDITEVINK